MREVNLTRPLLLPLARGTVRDKASALRKKGIGPPGWNPHWFRHSRATALLLGRNRGVGGIPTVGVTRTFRRRWTFPAWSARTRHCVRRRTGRPTPPPGSCTMRDEHQFRSRTSTRLLGFGGSYPHPVARAGHRPRHRKSGRGFTENGERRLALTGLPDPFPTESDWRAHWQ